MSFEDEGTEHAGPRANADSPDSHSKSLKSYGYKLEPEPPKHRGCFAGASLILTCDGLRRIDAIKKGSLVYSFEEKSNGLIKDVVTRLDVYKNCDAVNLFIEGVKRPIQTTIDHPILTRSGWKRCRELNPGDWLVSYDGSLEMSFIRVDRLEAAAKLAVCYNLYTATGSYIVDGIVADSYVHARAVRKLAKLIAAGLSQTVSRACSF